MLSLELARPKCVLQEIKVLKTYIVTNPFSIKRDSYNIMVDKRKPIDKEKKIIFFIYDESLAKQLIIT